jgi:indolepyruvate ferredoxin oxidoreductase beta subunit
VSEEKLIDACRSAAKTMHAFDMAAIAEATGQRDSAVLFGSPRRRRRVAVPAPGLRGRDQARRRRHQASLAAFTAGFEATTSGTRRSKTPAAVHAAADARRTGFGRDADQGVAAQPIPAELAAGERDISPASRAIIRAGIERTADYQDLAYARLYLDRLAPIAAADTMDACSPRPRGSLRSACPTRTRSASPN